ncbi:hypothetical protein PILCRDRAFT_803728, partial [Piloderma croceum F 1598]
MLWLSGGPGAGKSSIASSLVQRLREQRRLGSCFFFSRHHAGLNDAAALWRSVAYDLARFDHNFAVSLIEALKERRVDPERPEIELHFRLMIEEPSKRSYAFFPQDMAPIIVLDALDECRCDTRDRSQWNALLRTLSRWSDLPRVFKIIVTSRDPVSKSFSEKTCKHIVLLTGDLVTPEATRDIHHFFTERFAKITETVSSKWPGHRRILQLTTQAAGLFIWAETVMNFVERGIPEEQLDLVLKGNFGGGQDLTNLYRQVLEQSFGESDSRMLEALTTVLGVIVLAKVPLRRSDLQYFVCETDLVIHRILAKLSSVISMDTAEGTLRVIHLSFAEFLCDKERCPKNFFIDRNMQSEKLTAMCLQVMRDGLHFNICDLETSYNRNDDVEALAARIKKHIPGHLSFSCRFWAVYLQDVTGNEFTNGTLLDEIENFFYSRFLYWLEVLSLIKELGMAPVALRIVARWIGNTKAELSKFVTDARQFVVSFETPISESVPHIYLSALPFSPPESMVSKHFLPQFSRILSVTSASRPALLNVLIGHLDGVLSVDFSPDGKRIASGSGDRTIRVWDAGTGDVMVAPFKGHTETVCSVAFSPNGERIVSGSGDRTIRVWDAWTGETVIGPFIGHTDWVRSVGFSPDGKRIVSGSDDRTIVVWDAEASKTVAGPLRAHTDWVCSVAFSPDGKRIVSGSGDGTVIVWSSRTGEILATSLDPSGWIFSVAFSPDGELIVSGSDEMISIMDVETGDDVNNHIGSIRSVALSPDGKYFVVGADDTTCRVCDLQTGNTVVGPFDGHIDCIRSVQFSPDGKRIVSGSDDGTIRVWDCEIAEETCEGHTDMVHSVAFSPDGKRIVSGPRDKTIMVWNAKTGKSVTQPLTGHKDWVFSVGFSPDGDRIVSGSSDKTIRIWDAETGNVMAAPFKGHTETVCSVAFSPNGERIVSSSGDRTIRVWNAGTGETVVGPFIGHADWVRSVGFSPDGKRIVSGSDDGTIIVWNAETGKTMAGPFRAHTDWVCSVAFSPDGTHIVSGSGDETIKVCNADTGEIVAEPFDGEDWVFSVGFSADGKYIVSGAGAEVTLIWNVETSEIVARPIDDRESGLTRSARRLISLEEDLEGELDDIADGLLGRDIRSVGFSPDGECIVFALGNKICIWHFEITRAVHNHIDVLNAIGGPIVLNSCRQTKSRGWVSDGHKLLFWVPHEDRESICGIDAVHIMGTPAPQLDLGRYVHGTSWTRCRAKPHANMQHPSSNTSED